MSVKLCDMLGVLIAAYLAASERGDKDACNRLHFQSQEISNGQPWACTYRPSLLLDECTTTKMVFQVAVTHHDGSRTNHHIRVFPEFGRLRIVVTGRDTAGIKTKLENEFKNILSAII